MHRLCGLVLAAGWLTLAHASDGAVESLREQGLLEYDHGHYAAAVVYFHSAAEAGDAHSAEILALMYRFGPRLYDDQVMVDTAQSAHWATMAANRARVDAANPMSARR